MLEALVGGEYGGGVLVAPIHELEEQHGASVTDRQIADLIDDEQRGMREHGKALRQASGGLSLLE